MINFANPMWLWGLSTLLIPIGIHLLSRKEGRVIRIGSIRHLDESNTAQFSSIRLNEILLLILRCLVIILVILFLSGIQFNNVNKHKASWLVIEKSLLNRKEVSTAIDSLKMQGYEVRLLAESFPLIEDTTNVSSSEDYWHLIEELSIQAENEVVVLSANRISNFKGQRTSIPETIHWIPIPTEPATYPIYATRLSDNTISIRQIYTDNLQTHVETVKASVSSDQKYVSDTHPQISIALPDTIEIISVYDSDHAYDNEILNAVTSAIRNEVNPITFKSIKISDWDSSTNCDWLFWLTANPLPSENQTKQILSFEIKSGRPLLEQQKPHRWVLTKRLHEEVILKEHFALQLARILRRDIYAQSKKINTLHDQRTLPEAMTFAPNDQTIQPRQQNKISSASMNSYILFALLVLMTLERILAYKRNQ